MGFRDLVRLKLRELEEPKFDGTLSGAHPLHPEKMSPGASLFDGRLIDADGNLVRSWNASYLSLLLPDKRYAAQQKYESRCWGLYTWDDEPVWEKDIPIHHELMLTRNGTLITLTKEMRPYKRRCVDFCVIVEFDLQGRELFRWSTWDHLQEIQLHHRKLELDRPRVFFLPEPAGRKEGTPWGGNYDYYRLNSLQLLPSTELGRRDRRFREGNWLISARHGSMLFILDQDTQAIVWKCIDADVRDRLEGQHGAQMLDNGRILVFDNGRYRGWSRVIELDPVTLEVAWEYRAPGFFTSSQGYAQRLRNGNTLITESECGRAFEITPEKEIVWEYYHPETQNESNSMHPENYGRRQWIYRMVRLDRRTND